MAFTGYQGTPDAFSRAYVSPEPRLAVRYQVSPRWVVKAGAGLYAQPPDATAFSQAFGNPFLGPQHGVQAVVGGEVDSAPRVARGGRRLLQDAARPGCLVAEPGPALAGKRWSRAGLRRGAAGRQQISTRFFGWVVYTLSQSERKDHPDEAWYPFQFDQTHILTLILSWALPREWRVGGRFRYVTGDPYTPVVGSFYDATSDRYTPILGGTNSGRLPSFNQLDLRVDKAFTFNRWRLSAYLDVQNVYRAENRRRSDTTTTTEFPSPSPGCRSCRFSASGGTSDVPAFGFRVGPGGARVRWRLPELLGAASHVRDGIARPRREGRPTPGGAGRDHHAVAAGRGHLWRRHRRELEPVSGPAAARRGGQRRLRRRDGQLATGRRGNDRHRHHAPGFGRRARRTGRDGRRLPAARGAGDRGRRRLDDGLSFAARAAGATGQRQPADRRGVGRLGSGTAAPLDEACRWR